MADEQAQGAETPVIELAQGATPPATAPSPVPPAPKAVETTPPNGHIPPEQWQALQERQRNTERQLAQIELEKYEIANPIVKMEKYASKWQELLTQKNTPGHRYSALSHDELRRIMLADSPVEQPTPVPTVISVPSFSPSVAPDLPQGSISQEAKGYLSMRYTDAQIKAAERSAG